MKVLAIALNTFREAIRDRILYNLLIFALALIVLSLFLRTLSIHQDVKIVVDFSLAAMGIVGTLMGVFLGIGLVYKEIERRTISVIAAKPVARAHFLLGKYLGLVLTVGVNIGLMTLWMYWILAFTERAFDLSLLPAVLLIFMELMLIIAIALLFSTFTTGTLSAMLSLLLVVIGHMTVNFRLLAGKIGSPAARTAGELLYYLVPNLSTFNIKGQVVYRLPVPASVVGGALLYGLLISAVLFLLAAAIFQRRDLR
ncbi:MAG: ABC transporter permease [Deltaproteobacteria bacterium]|nr:ABC transporter permease [Deltaproteobacteria bacterium]